MTACDEDRLAEAYNRGLACEKAGDIAGAVAAFRAVLAMDLADRGGAAIRLAALGHGPVPDRASEAYVATLFDQNAEAFDDMLVEQLGYHVPMLLRELLRARGLSGVSRLLDLGCGTGLSGQALNDMAAHATGVDLSEGMLAVADDKAVYDELYVGDAEGFLAASLEDGAEPWDLIVATDVLPYLGRIAGLLSAAAACLKPAGWLAVSTEALAEDHPEGFAVGPLHRFAHGVGHVRACLEAAGLAVVAVEPIVVRHDRGQPIPGHLILAQRAV